MGMGEGEMGEGGAPMMWFDIDSPKVFFFQDDFHILIIKSIHLQITNTWNILI